MCDHKNKQSLFSLSNVYAYLKFIDLTFVFDCDLSTWLCVYFQCIKAMENLSDVYFSFRFQCNSISHIKCHFFEIFFCFVLSSVYMHIYWFSSFSTVCTYNIIICWYIHRCVNLWIFIYAHPFFSHFNIICCVCVYVNYLFWSTIFWEGKIYRKYCCFSYLLLVKFVYIVLANFHVNCVIIRIWLILMLWMYQIW